MYRGREYWGEDHYVAGEFSVLVFVIGRGCVTGFTYHGCLYVDRDEGGFFMVRFYLAVAVLFLFLGCAMYVIWLGVLYVFTFYEGDLFVSIPRGTVLSVVM